MSPKRLKFTILAAWAVRQAQAQGRSLHQGRRLALCLMLAMGVYAGLAPAVRAQEPNLTGTYHETYAIFDVVIDLLHQGDDFSGKATITLCGFDIGIFNFKGKVRQDGLIVAKDKDGATFVGRLSPDQSKVQGTVVHKPDKLYDFTINRPEGGWGSPPE